jgi:acyl-CoA synthetase (AMP-forming)/AMP-acid ligase II
LATLPHLIEDLVSQFGDRPQIEDAGGSLSFSEVCRQSAILARGLLAAGVGKGSKVGLLLPNGRDWVAAWSAVTRIGAVAVLLSTFSKPRELAYVLRHADIDTLLTADRFLNNDYVARIAEALPGLADRSGAQPLTLAAAPFLRSIWIFGEATPAWARGRREALDALADHGGFDAPLLAGVEAEVMPSDPAVMIYTSGSSADPKAVLHSHGGVVRQARSMAGYMTFDPGDRLMTTQPFFWVGGLCTSLLAANIRGAAIICPETPSAEDMVETLRRCGVTHLSLWPAQIAALRASPAFTDGDFARLKPTSAQQLGLFGLATPERTPNSLGMSETFGPHSMEYPPEPLPVSRAGSFGRAVASIERKIINPVTGQTLAPGEPGEICVRGHALMIGFYKKEASECFDPEGFFHTGDFGWITEDGHLFFSGRGGEMIKTSGANVAPREIELVLLKEPGVLDAAVVAVPHARLGQMVVAAVAPRTGEVLDEHQLIASLQAQMSSYKVPKRIYVLEYAELPRTDSGKVQKRVLTDMLSARIAAAEVDA